jgi:hypothetical protein
MESVFPVVSLAKSYAVANVLIQKQTIHIVVNVRTSVPKAKNAKPDPVLQSVKKDKISVVNNV